MAFTRSLDSHGSCRLDVLDLHKLRAHPLAETHSVDDQVEWLDKTHVLRRDGADAWVVSSNGGCEPKKFVTDAESAVVIR